MTLIATPQALVRFGGGAIFANSLVLGSPIDGKLGTNVLGSFQTAAVPSIQRMAIRRGRTSLDDDFGAGTAVIEFLDRTGAWNPNNPNSPYVNQLVPGVQLQCRVVRNNQATDLFAGYIRNYDYQFVVGEPWARVTITAEDALYIFNLAPIASVPGAAAGDLPGERIDLILDALQWPQSARAIETGTVTLQADSGEQRNMLDAIRAVEQTDLGMFFIDTGGRATFYSRVTTAQKASATPVRFTDAGQDLKFKAIDFTYADDDVINSCTVNRAGGTPQTATSPSSILVYFTRQATRNDLLMQTDDRALQQAKAIVAYRRNAKVRLKTIEFDVLDSDSYAAALIDFATHIAVDKQYPNSNFQLSATVQGIDHEITPDRWTTTFSTAEALAYAFVLGSTQYGVIDQNII
jgi:hypothetical protein